MKSSIHLTQTMENQDFLLQLCSRLDNQSLENLSHTSLWTSIRLFARDQYFWHLRVQHLVGRELKLRPEADWKNPYTAQVLADELTVDILLEVYDPSADNNSAIVSACRLEYLGTIKVLLSDSRIDPSVSDNLPIGRASASGYSEVVKLLLDDSRVDPSADDNYAINRASANGHSEVVKLLLTDSRVYPATENNLPIRYSSRYGHSEVVKLLLADPRVDPTADNNFATRQAYIRGHTQVVKLLEQDQRVDPNMIFLW